MTKYALTDVHIRNLKAQGKQYEVGDKKSKGLTLRVSPNGTKSFYVMYRHHGKQRRFKLGCYGDLSLSDARKQARIVRVEALQGKDPAAERAQRKASPTAFNQYIDIFIERHAKVNTQRWRETERILKREFGRRWRGRDLSAITRKDVVHVLDTILARGAPIASNRALAAIRKLMNWAVESGDLEVSPCAGVKARAKAKSCDRVLDKAEILAIWQATVKMGYPFGALVQLLFLTAQRLNEVASLKWDDIDFDKAQWSMPTNKSARPHEVPLSPAAVEILKAIPKTQSAYVFPAKGNPNNALSGFSYWKRKLNTMSGTTGWTLHDIRRTVATGMAALDIEQDLVDRILNHKKGEAGTVSRIYNRHHYINQRRDALVAWQIDVCRLTGQTLNAAA